MDYPKIDNEKKVLEKSYILKNLNPSVLYKSKINSILSYLIENNISINSDSKKLFMDFLDRKKVMSRSYRYQYTKAFDIIISTYPNFYVNGFTMKTIKIGNYRLNDIIADFICKTNANRKTAKRYICSIRLFYNTYNMINHNNVKLFIDTHNITNNTKKQYLRDIKAFTKYLYDYSYITKNSYIEIMNIKIKGSEQIKKDILTTSQIAEIIKHAPKSHILEIGLCYYGALRYYEIDHYKDLGKYLEVKGKGNKKVCVAIPNKLRNILDNYTEVTNYQTFLEWLKNICKSMFNKHITTHCLRTSYAIFLYQKTKDIQLVKRHLRHKNVETTSRYLDHINEMDYFNKIE